MPKQRSTKTCAFLLQNPTILPWLWGSYNPSESQAAHFTSSKTSAAGDVLNSLKPSTFTLLQDLGVSENSVTLNPMVLLIIIPIKWLFHWEYTQHFQTNPFVWYVHRLRAVLGPVKGIPWSTRVVFHGWFPWHFNDRVLGGGIEACSKVKTERNTRKTIENPSHPRVPSIVPTCSNMPLDVPCSSIFQVKYAKYPSRFHRVIEDMWISGPWDWLHHATRVTPPHLGTPSQEKDGQGMRSILVQCTSACGCGYLMLPTGCLPRSLRAAKRRPHFELTRS